MIMALAGMVGEFVPTATTDLHTQFLRPGTGPRDHGPGRGDPGWAARSPFTRAELSAEETGKPVALASATLALP